MKHSSSPDSIALTKSQVALVEEYARLHEMGGMQPAMAKIIALLFMSDEVELTFDQIQQTLALSKSGTSQAINQLLATRRIKYKTRLGDRKRYFYVPLSEWKSTVVEHFEGVAALAALNKRILSERSANNKEFNKSLREMTDFLAEVHKVLSQMLVKKG